MAAGWFSLFLCFGFLFGLLECSISDRDPIYRETGSKIQRALHYIDKIEREALGLKEFISELPRREVSEYQSQVSGLISKVKQDRKVLGRVISKIANYGILV